MKVMFSSDGWEDYLFWQDTDRRMLVAVNKLIKECQRTPFSGAGQPEPLRNQLSGLWSRRINQKHRLIYRVTDVAIDIIQCRFHYDAR
jgi:toxin YoeB